MSVKYVLSLLRARAPGIQAANSPIIIDEMLNSTELLSVSLRWYFEKKINAVQCRDGKRSDSSFRHLAVSTSVQSSVLSRGKILGPRETALKVLKGCVTRGLFCYLEYSCDYNCTAKTIPRANKDCVP